MIKVYLVASVLLSVGSFAAGHWASDLSWQSDWDEHIRADSKANQDAAEKALVAQSEYQKLQDKVDEHAEQITKQTVVDVAASDVAAAGVRSEFGRIKALPKINTCETTSERAAAATDRIVLTELLEQADGRATAYAKAADQNRAAGLICQQYYSVLYKSVVM